MAAILGATAFCALFVYALRTQPLFEDGANYEFYCGTSSAQIVLSKNPYLTKLIRLDVRGECAHYEGDCYQKLAERYDAKLVFCEEAAGVMNYYLYSPELGRSILLNGEEINLHIAVGNGQTAIGTPLIFGGI